MTNEYGKEIKA